MKAKAQQPLVREYRLHCAYYNFCQIHQTVRVTPAMVVSKIISKFGLHVLALSNLMILRSRGRSIWSIKHQNVGI